MQITEHLLSANEYPTRWVARAVYRCRCQLNEHATDMPSLQSLYIYPVKSCLGIEVSASAFNDWGMQWDREWMFVDDAGQMITQRQYPQLSRIATRLSVEKERLELSAVGFETQSIAFHQRGIRTSAQVWEDSCVGIDQGDAVAAWFTEVCGISGRLLRFDPRQQRRVAIPSAFQDLKNSHTAFADGFPVLIISQASLDDLNTRLAEPVPMQRFRPNMVIADCEAYDEDQWQQIQIGDMYFDLVKPCARCIFTCVDQATGLTAKEPLRTIASYRDDVHFGMNAIHRGTTQIRIGDAVDICK